MVDREKDFVGTQVSRNLVPSGWRRCLSLEGFLRHCGGGSEIGESIRIDLEQLPCVVDLAQSSGRVGSSATLGTNSVFKGNILALTSITVTTGVNLEGAAAEWRGHVGRRCLDQLYLDRLYLDQLYLDRLYLDRLYLDR